MKQSTMTPKAHVERRWLRLVWQGHNLGRFYTTEAACRYLYCCDVEDDSVTIHALWTPRLRTQHKVELTEDVTVELLAQSIQYHRIHPEYLLVPAQEWVHDWRQSIANDAGLSLMAIEGHLWWKAQELVLHTMRTLKRVYFTSLLFATNAVAGEEHPYEQEEEPAV